jgi:hypothetical protein
VHHPILPCALWPKWFHIEQSLCNLLENLVGLLARRPLKLSKVFGCFDSPIATVGTTGLEKGYGKKFCAVQWVPMEASLGRWMRVMLVGLGLCTISMALFATTIFYLEKLSLGHQMFDAEVRIS